jgi:hypothetical protein
MLRPTAAIWADPSTVVETGWTTVVTASPQEADPDTLCAPIDPPPPAGKPRYVPPTREMQKCQQAIEAHATLSLHTQRSPAMKAHDDQIEADFGSCFETIKSNPHPFSGFNPNQACGEPYERWAQSFEPNLNADNPVVAAEMRRSLAAVRKAQASCLSRATAALASSHKVRASAAATTPLAELRAIPAGQRRPEETARIAAEIAACKAEAQRRREQRLQTLAAKGVAALEGLEEAYLLPEEVQVLREAIAARQALLEQRLADRKWVAPVLSAALCIASDTKQAAAKEIRTEQTYARKYGGMVDKAKIYELQQTIRSQDEQIAAIRASLRQLKSSPQSCSGKLVTRIYECYPRADGRPNDAVCREREVADYVDLAIPLMGAPWEGDSE